MQFSINIRKLYKPVQPAVNDKGLKVTYREILPDSSLQNLIYCYWELRSNETLVNPFTYRVVADGCIDIFFEMNYPTESFVMGFCKKYTEFPLENSFHYAGIRFYPTIFPAVFKVNAKELSNRYIKLEEILHDTSGFIRNNVSSGITFLELKTILDTYFSKYPGIKEIKTDPRFLNALNLILESHGVINVGKDLNTGLSERQLRRYFEYYIGATAKTFSKVVRFQNILNAKPSTQSLKENRLFFDMGYYDQAHFIKEFKNFYGVTPSKAFGR